MDSLAALALATEAPKQDVLKRKPYRRDEYIISGKMVKHILGNSIYEIIVVYAMAFAGEYWLPEDPNYFPRSERNGHAYVYPGRPEDWDQSPLYEVYETEYGSSR